MNLVIFFFFLLRLYSYNLEYLRENHVPVALSRERTGIGIVYQTSAVEIRWIAYPRDE